MESVSDFSVAQGWLNNLISRQMEANCQTFLVSLVKYDVGYVIG